MLLQSADAAMQSVLWADIHRRSDGFPDARPLLAHYSSVVVAEQILRTEEVWFSNPLFMNDFEELRYGIEIGASEFRTNQALVTACGTAENLALLLEEFESRLSEFEQDDALDIYVLCFSKYSPEDFEGKLSMWRGYGANGTGAALVFDSQELPFVEGSPFLVDKVFYASREERVLWVRDHLDSLAAVVKSVGPSPQNLKLAALRWLERLKLFSVFTKHGGFREEDEWRIVYMPDRDHDNLHKKDLGYAVTSRGVEPKLKLKVAKLPGVMAGNFCLDSLLDRIILGPVNSSEIARRAMIRMLEVIGKESLAPLVSASEIPYRPSR